jgi:hypothetical protein
LRYDRAAICVLGEGRRVGRLTDPAGLEAELAMTAHWWEQRSFAIHNVLTNCLRTGDLTLPFEAGNSVPLATHLPALRAALSKARLDGYASIQPAPSVLVVAVDPRISRGEPGIDVVEQTARAAAGWEHEPHLVRTVSMVRRMRERLHHYPYLAPLTIFPLSAQDIAELLLGPLEYVTVLNLPCPNNVVYLPHYPL